MEYREHDYTALPDNLKESAMQADSIWGQAYRDMEYIGSLIKGPDLDGWYDCMDFFYDKDRSMFWHGRYFYIDRWGEMIFVPSSVRLFGRQIPAWEHAGKDKKGK